MDQFYHDPETSQQLVKKGHDQDAWWLLQSNFKLGQGYVPQSPRIVPLDGKPLPPEIYKNQYYAPAVLKDEQNPPAQENRVKVVINGRAFYSSNYFPRQAKGIASDYRLFTAVEEIYGAATGYILDMAEAWLLLFNKRTCEITFDLSNFKQSVKA